MGNNHEYEEALRTAESFLHGEQKDKDAAFAVTLPFQTAQILKHYFSGLLSTHKIFLGVREAQDSSGITHEEGMLSTITAKLRGCLPNRYEKRALNGKSIPAIRVQLNTREVGYMNAQLLFAMHINRDDYTGPYEEEWRELSFRSIQEKSVALIGLNTAFIQAGGEARAEFLDLYKGSE